MVNQIEEQELTLDTVLRCLVPNEDGSGYIERLTTVRQLTGILKFPDLTTTAGKLFGWDGSNNPVAIDGSLIDHADATITMHGFMSVADKAWALAAFSTYAQMRGFTHPDLIIGRVVLLSGGAAFMDGEEGLFVVTDANPGADDNHSIIASVAGLYWFRRVTEALGESVTQTYVDNADALALKKSSNLSDVQNASTARTSLGLLSAALHAATDFDTAGSAATALTTAESFATSADITVLTSAHTYADTGDATKANKGLNTDITQLQGLTTQITQDQGGVGDYAAFMFTKSWVKSATTTAEPVAPAFGDRYLLPHVGVTGTHWVGHADIVAEYVHLANGTGGWIFSGTPKIDQQLFAQDTRFVYKYQGAVTTPWKRIKSKLAFVSDFNTFSDADAFATASGRHLVVDEDITLTANPTIFTTPQIRVSGGIITRGVNAVTIPLLIAPATVQVFDKTGTGAVTITAQDKVSLKWFGATGDGVTADDVPIDQAILCLKNMPAGGTLYVPNAIYAVYAPHVVDFTAKTAGSYAIEFEGQTRGGAVFKDYFTTADYMFVIGNAALSTEGVALRNLSFNSNTTYASPSPCIGYVNLDFCLNARVENVVMRSGGLACRQLYVGRAQGMMITNSEFHGYAEGLPALGCSFGGITFGADTHAHGGQCSVIDNCLMRDFRNATKTGFALDLKAGGGSEHFIINCTLENCDNIRHINQPRCHFVNNEIETGYLNWTVSKANNVGAATLTKDPSTPVLSNGMLGVYNVICTTPGASGVAIFTVFDPVGINIGTYTVGAAAFAIGIKFTMANAGIASSVGDQFMYINTSLALPGGASIVVGGKNTGTGNLTINSPVTDGIAYCGNYVAVCTAASAGAGTFTVYNPISTSPGTVIAGGAALTIDGTGSPTGVAVPVIMQFTVTVGGTDYVVGDAFFVNALGDIITAIGNNSSATIITNTYFSDESISSDGVGNLRYFDCQYASAVMIGPSISFIFATGYVVYQSVNNGNKQSQLKNNVGLAHTAIYRPPAMIEGKWIIDENIEGTTTENRIIQPDGLVTTPIIDITNNREIELSPASATTYTATLGGYVGKAATTLFCGTANVTLKHGTIFFLPAKADTTFASGTHLHLIPTIGSGAGSVPVYRVTIASATATGGVYQNVCNVLGTSGAIAIDLTKGVEFEITPSGATTISITNAPGAGFTFNVILKITNGGTNITWPAMSWKRGTAPTLQVTGVDWISIWSDSAGNLWGDY